MYRLVHAVSAGWCFRGGRDTGRWERWGCGKKNRWKPIWISKNHMNIQEYLYIYIQHQDVLLSVIWNIQQWGLKMRFCPAKIMLLHKEKLRFYPRRSFGGWWSCVDQFEYERNQFWGTQFWSKQRSDKALKSYCRSEKHSKKPETTGGNWGFQDLCCSGLPQCLKIVSL